MSRHGYTDDCDDNWANIRWRGQVASAIRGKRGQTFLKELEVALLALPHKRLCLGVLSNGDDVCALGAVAVQREIKKGANSLDEAMQKIKQADPSELDAEDTAAEMGIATQLAQEIMFINDEWGYHGMAPEQRYNEVLSWVRKQIQEPRP